VKCKYTSHQNALKFIEIKLTFLLAVQKMYSIIACLFMALLSSFHQVKAETKTLVPSKALSLSSTSTLTDRIRNSDLLMQLRDEAISTTKVPFTGREEILSDIMSSRHDVPLRLEHAKQKINEYKDKFCTLEDLDECLRDPERLVRSPELLESLYRAAEAMSKGSAKAVENGLALVESAEIQREFAICYVGTTMSITGIGTTIVELVAPWIIPGTLGGPLGWACASLVVGGTALSAVKCNDPLVAYIDTIKRMAQIGSVAGAAVGTMFLLSQLDLAHLAQIISHLDHSNAEAVRELIVAVMSSF
jgi:hypothetical protein